MTTHRPHVLEHCSDLVGNTQHRVEHWQFCILKTSDKNLASRFHKAELRDGLSTVALGFAELDWDQEPSSDSMQAQSDGISTQIDWPIKAFDKTAADDYLGSSLVDELKRSTTFTNGNAAADDNDEGKNKRDDHEDDEDLIMLYNIPEYRKAAINRMKAVQHILEKLDPHELDNLPYSNNLFKVYAQALQQKCNDPRPDIIKKIALYHWVIKTDLLNLQPWALI